MKKLFLAILTMVAIAAPVPAHAGDEFRDASNGKTSRADVAGGILRSVSTPVTVFDSQARTVTANSTDQTNYAGLGVICLLDITAASGTTPTLDIKLQYKDTVPTVNKYVDIPAAAFAQKTATGSDSIVIYPGVAITANRSVSSAMPRDWRAVATIGGTTPSFTFTLDCSYLH